MSEAKTSAINFDFSTLHKRSDIAFALGLMSVLVVLILPLPKMLLDLSLAISLAFSVLILMTVLFIEKPLDFSTFPTVLLVATMIRLSLNVASTRLILSHGHEGTGAAGEVIRAFGNFVMGGNFIIGIIVFSILVIVNFIVITKGSGRIAEVSARFSLDAMPGKQMAVDADLSAGLIDEQTAKKRRKELEDESNFYGAMDGAAKFVRGDAIAGLLITIINIVGGIIIGVFQQGVSFQDAAHSYTLLTVGDGLVTQIPALLVSTAAGMLVSKAGQDGSTDKALVTQFSAYPTALGLSSFLMAALAVLPGIPMLPFMLLSGVTGFMSWRLSSAQASPKQDEKKDEAELNAQENVGKHPASQTGQMLQMDHVRLEVGYGLLNLVSSDKTVKLTDQIKGLRKQLASDVGFVLPAVRIQDNLQLPPNGYSIKIKEIEVGFGEVQPQMLLAIDPQARDLDLPGEKTKEPTFGLPALWINPTYRQDAESKGITVVEPGTVIITHLTELIKDNMAEMLSFAETQKLLDELDPLHQKLVNDLIPNQISTTGLQRVLQNLLSERVSIRDLSTILEATSEACTFTRNVAVITEHVRTRLARQICNANTGLDGALPILTLSPQWEQIFLESLVGDSEVKQLALAPSHLQEFSSKIKQVYDRFTTMGDIPVLLTSPAIRPYVRSLIERFRPQTVVMSQSEIHPKIKIRTLAQL